MPYVGKYFQEFDSERTMQNLTLVKNGNIRIEGASESTELPFEAFKHAYGDFHVMEMIQYADTDVNAFLNKAVNLLEQYYDNFDYYRRCGYKIVMFLSYIQGASTFRIEAAQLEKLGEHKVSLEVLDCSDELND